MSDLTNNQSDVPSWATQVMFDLGRLIDSVAGELTTAEQNLLDAGYLLLRHRFAQSTLPDPANTVHLLVRSALADLDEAQA